MLRLNIPAIAVRGIHTTAVGNAVNLRRVRSGRYKVSNKRNVWLTYEQAKYPESIAVDKAWNSWNTSKYHKNPKNLYHKNPKNLDTQKICCNRPKILKF